MSVNYSRPFEANKTQARPLAKVIFKYLKIIVLVFFVLAFCGAIFVKVDTPAAAELTDKYLRPIFGDKQIIFLEKIFFNFSDNVTKFIYNFKKPSVPQFINSGVNSNLSSSLHLAPIPPNPAFAPLADEGIWRDIPLNIFPNKEVMAYAFIRPDAARSFTIVSVVKIDSSVLALGSVAGTVEPGGKVGKFGPGRVPKNIAQSGNLVAAFDGGFQYRDGAYGMIVGDTVYLPLKNDLATVVGYADGEIKIFNYTGQPLGSDVVFARQNGPMLIENGKIVVTNPDSRKIWGRVVGSDMYTWRSGIGLTQYGELVFAAGNNLSPQTLAESLEVAGAINALQLDINQYWVRFNIFNSIGGGQYNSSPLDKSMPDGSKEYLKGYQKDFFYIYKK